VSKGNFYGLWGGRILENLFYRFVLFVCKFWQARDFAPTEARINATRWGDETNCCISRARAKRIRRINLFKSSRSRCDFARTEARIMCLRRDGLRHWGYFERTHGANKCIYRQILNKK